jgi:hypothetical protein
MLSKIDRRVRTMSLSLHPMDMSFAMRKRMSGLRGFLPAGVGALAAWACNVLRGAAGASPTPPEHRAMPFPVDNWLREDVGLLPLADSRPPLHQRPTTPRPAYFPTDNHLREDIGLPPVIAESGAFSCTVTAHRRLH